MSTWVLREWQKPGDITDIPRPDNVYVSNTTRFVENNSFLRLRTISLSYSLPAKWVSAAKLRSLMVYASGTNLLTFTKWSGRDPEFATASLTGAQYPALKTIQAGVRVGF
jgi:hypothetical protein